MATLETFKPGMILNNELTFRDPFILHFIPDFDTGLNDYYNALPFPKNRIHSIVIKSNIVKVGNVVVNPRNYFNNVKTFMPRIYNRFQTKNVPNGKFIIIDHSPIIPAIYKLKPISPRNSVFYLFNYLKNEYQYVKDMFPNINNVTLFSFSKNGLYETLDQALPLFRNKLEIFDFFDTKVLAHSGKSSVVFITKNVDSNIELNIPSFRKLNLTSLITTEKKTNLEYTYNSFVKEIVKSPKIKDTELNPEILNSAITKLKIKDDAITENLRIIISDHIKNNKNVNEDELNQLILKTLHKTLYGTEKIKDEFIQNPDLLLQQISDTTFFSKEVLVNPEADTSALIRPNEEFIKIKNISGPVRHKHEFSENIHTHVETLFKTLENKEYPIKIKEIQYEIKDNNLNRFIEYSITVQNLKEGHKEPYVIKLQIPDIVNDKYFKLNGKEYVLSSQQYLKPITKSTHNEARFLTHFNMITQRLVNFKYSPSDIESILQYIYNFYPKSVDKLESKKIIFKSGTIIDLDSHELPYVSEKEKLVFESGQYYVYKDDVKQDKPVKKTEFIYEKLSNIINGLNPNDNLKKSIRSIQYIDIHVMGKFIPFIFALWQQIGLTEALIKLGIDFEITGFVDKSDTRKKIVFNLMDDKFLVIYPENKKQEYIVNGLYKYDINNQFTSAQLSDHKSCYEILVNNANNKIINNLNKMMELSIDPTTKKLLERDNLPTNIIDIISGPLLDKLFNDPPDHPSDLTSLRSRMSEYMTELIYNEIAMSYRTYSDRLSYDKDNAKMFLDERYIIRILLNQHKHSDDTGSNNIDYVEPFSPVDEIIKSSKVVRTGKGGVPSKQAFKKEHRNIHPTYIGNIAAHSTSESANVGLVNYHTLGALISDDFGIYGFKPKNSDNDHWDSVSIDEALIPFQNSMHSDRLILARTHIGQKIPILNGEQPIVQSGAEHLVGKLVSSKFVHRTNDDGEVIKVEKDKLVKVKYSDGTIETFDILPRFSATKRNSTIHITLDSLKEGDKFKKDDLIAWNKSFNNGVLAIGKNKKLAVINYLGKSHEDGYVISQECADDYVTELITKVPVIIPPNTKIIFFNRNTDTVLNESLIKFQYDKLNNVDDYLDSYNLGDDQLELSEEEKTEESEESTIESLYKYDKNVFDIKSPGGQIVKVKIRLNTKVNIDKIIINEWNRQNAEIKNLKLELSNNVKMKNSKSEIFLDNVDTSVVRVGNHKVKGSEFEGALIEFYISVKKPLTHGDKLSNRFGAKGVVNHIIKQDKIPYGDFSGNIDFFIAPNSVIGRKNTVIIKEIYLSKILHNLKPKSLEILESKGFDKFKKTIIDIYSILDRSGRHTNYLDALFDSMTEDKAKELLSNPNFMFNIIIPPFNNVSFKDIKKAAEKLNIPLDEKVFIPEIGTWSDPVPVGYAYFSPMEQLSSDYESTRSTAGYNPVTGQPLKRKAKMGGQSIGNLDVYALLTYDCNTMLEELMVGRSDNIKVKNEMINNIIRTGKTELPEITEHNQGKTQDTFKIMMLSMGLYVTGKF